MENAGYVIGRENEKLIESNQNKESNLVNRVVADCDESSSSKDTSKIDDLESLQSIEEVSRDTIKRDDLESLQSIEKMFITNPLEKKASNFEKYNEAMLWHVRLGHTSLSYLKKLQKVIKILEKVKFDDSILECEVCIMAKMEKLPFKEMRKRAERPLQVSHTAAMRPIEPTPYPGLKRLIVDFVDDYSRFAIAYCVKSKDEAGEALKKYLVSPCNLLGENEKICYIRSDQGTEFTGGKFLEILREEKIEAELSPPYTPEHNGVAERLNKTSQEKVRAYMFDSGLSKSM